MASQPVRNHHETALMLIAAGAGRAMLVRWRTAGG
jgi:hypothetical protein